MASEQPKQNDGGPAFPEHPLEHDCYWYPGTRGMSLRDYFAGQALAGIMAADSMIFCHKAAQWAYETADAMLEARNQ